MYDKTHNTYCKTPVLPFYKDDVRDVLLFLASETPGPHRAPQPLSDPATLRYLGMYKLTLHFIQKKMLWRDLTLLLLHLTKMKSFPFDLKVMIPNQVQKFRRRKSLQSLDSKLILCKIWLPTIKILLASLFLNGEKRDPPVKRRFIVLICVCL